MIRNIAVSGEEMDMRAFVLSGGGNRGALQVGALRALLEHDIYPDIIVGCSAGALNAAFLAQDVSPAQTERLATLWRHTQKEHIYPGGRLSVVWRLLTGKESLYDNRNFYAYLQEQGTTPALTFGDLSQETQLYITATHLDSERLHIFGNDPNDRVLDALMASTALPPLHPPWTINNERYIDGGTITPLPLRVALEEGATEIFALYIWEEPKPMSNLQKGLAAILDRSISTMLRLQAEHDLLLTEAARKIKLHEIRLRVDDPPGFEEWNQTDRLCAAGYETAMHYLSQLPLAHKTLVEPQASPLKRLSNALVRTWLNWMSSGEMTSTVPVRSDQ